VNEMTTTKIAETEIKVPEGFNEQKYSYENFHATISQDNAELSITAQLGDKHDFEKDVRITVAKYSGCWHVRVSNAKYLTATGKD